MYSFSSEDQFTSSERILEIISEPLFENLKLYKIRIRLEAPESSTMVQSASSYFRSNSFAFARISTKVSDMFTVYVPSDKKIDFKEVFRVNILVDSSCEWNSGWLCRNDNGPLIERCKDNGASANRCDDRSGLCSHYYFSWTPPTECDN